MIPADDGCAARGVGDNQTQLQDPRASHPAERLSVDRYFCLGDNLFTGSSTSVVDNGYLSAVGMEAGPKCFTDASRVISSSR